jgi:hypothetical protein
MSVVYKFLGLCSSADVNMLNDREMDKSRQGKASQRGRSRHRSMRIYCESDCYKPYMS